MLPSPLTKQIISKVEGLYSIAVLPSDDPSKREPVESKLAILAYPIIGEQIGHHRFALPCNTLHRHDDMRPL